MKKKILLFLLASIFTLSACGNNAAESTSSNTRISFKSAASYDYLSSLDGQEIEICGYMATSSPVDGSFMFLMNLPYQNCPFCKPNTSQLSNTMEVYPKEGSKFFLTTQAIKVTGTLKVYPVGEPFIDLFGYETSFLLVDAEYKIMKESELTSKMALWQKLSSSELINDIYSMYDYVYFLCCWPIYYVDSYTNSKGQLVKGFYLNNADALHFITTDGAQWNYGYKDNYFDNLVTRLEEISKTEFNDLKANILKAKGLADYAYNELIEERFTKTFQHIDRFDTDDYIYTMNDTELENKWETIYYEFTDWLGSFEM